MLNKYRGMLLWIIGACLLILLIPLITVFITSPDSSSYNIFVGWLFITLMSVCAILGGSTLYFLLKSIPINNKEE